MLWVEVGIVEMVKFDRSDVGMPLGESKGALVVEEESIEAVPVLEASVEWTAIPGTVLLAWEVEVAVGGVGKGNEY